MTHFWTRTAIIGLAASAMAACASAPQYDTPRGPATRPFEVPTPNFPITAPAGEVAEGDDRNPGPVPPADEVENEPIDSAPLAPPPTPAPVESAPLAPLAAPEAPPPPPPEPMVQTRTVTVAAGKVVDATGKPQTYEVKSGEGLDAIARKLNTTRKQLAADNDLKEPYSLRPGQKLKGPATKTKAYVVDSGDTLHSIARRFAVKAGDLAAFNNFDIAAAIRPGQKILLPPGYKDAGPITRVITERVAPPPAAAPIVVAAAPPPPTPAPPVLRPSQPAVTTPPPAPRPSAQAPSRPVVAEMRPAVAAPPPGPKPYTPGPSQMTTTPTTPRPATAPIIDTAAPPTDNEVAVAGRGRFQWPVRGEIASPFGPKGMGQRNDGVNIKAAAGTEVRSAAGGEVVYAGDQVPGFGNLVLVKHDSGWVTAYAHMSRVDVKMRQTIAQGQQIGAVGATGGVSEPQLHFEVRYAPSPRDKARPIDPALVLPR